MAHQSEMMTPCNPQPGPPSHHLPRSLWNPFLFPRHHKPKPLTCIQQQVSILSNQEEASSSKQLHLFFIILPNRACTSIQRCHLLGAIRKHQKLKRSTAQRTSGSSPCFSPSLNAVFTATHTECQLVHPKKRTLNKPHCAEHCTWIIF